MRQKPGTRKPSSEKTIKDIRRKTRRSFSSYEKIRIVLDGLRDEDSIAVLSSRRHCPEPVLYLVERISGGR